MDAEHDRGRFAQWFHEFRGPLRRYIGLRLRLRPADLDDVAQEVFLRLLRYARTDDVDDPRSYLYRVAANVATEWSMRAAQRMPHQSSWLEQLADAGDACSDVEQGQRDEVLAGALGRLPVRMQQILKLHFHEGLTHKEIADRLGLTPRIVKRDIIESYVRLRADAGVLELWSADPLVSRPRKAEGTR